MSDLLHISYLFIMQLDSWISEVLQWVRFAKKLISSRPSPPVSLTNALRPDCPLRLFREQQNSSENSEGTEGTESTEGTECSEHSENSELTAFRVACQVGQAFLPAL